MTKVLALINKEKFLEIILKCIKTQKLISNLLVFATIFLFSACSINQIKQEKNIDKKYVIANPYPTVMKVFVDENDFPYFIVEVKPKSLQFDCTLRNDSPYYWCGIDGTIKSPDPKLPNKVGAVFQSVVSKRTKATAEKLIKRLKKANKAVFLVSPVGYFIDEERKVFTNLMRGIYNSEECMNLFNEFSMCPGSARKFDLYGNKYIEEH